MGRANLDRVRLFDHYLVMARIRAFEEAAEQALKDGHVKGAIHLSIGQEAVAAGTCIHLAKTDLITTTHRGHGHAIAKGADVRAMFGELFGRANGTCQGKGGSMHIADFKVGMLGANGVVGAGIEIAAGAAHGVKLRGGAGIVVCFFGDGAINRGPFLEGLNWAKIYELPILFVCENNGFAATTRTAALSAGPGPGARAAALGLPVVEVDGNDVAAVDEAVGDLAARIRGGAGPQFLHAVTYRLKGHTAVDPAAYRPAAELAAKWQGDPMRRCADALGVAGVDDADIDAALTEARAEMARALATALAAPWPAPELAWADVQDVDATRPEARR
jgi:TPP-dependent pyruvate/acetoin dehydrogenase alpha subunit